MKEIDVGNETFAEFIENNSYYVDKTPLIKTLFKKGTSKVTLITRPRRFGKTLTMSTFHEFLRINPNNPDNPKDASYQERLFKDTKIFEDQEFCREHMGKYPVISITFKEVKGDTYELAFLQLKDVLRREIEEKCEYLLSSSKLNDLKKIQLLKLREDSYYSDGEFKKSLDSKAYDGKDDKTQIQNSLQSSLRFLTECLSKHHGVKPILLIDEYDVPLDKAASLGYYDRMVSLVSGLLGNALKTNPYLGKAVLTGCLRAAKESIFTGLNNLDVCSILDMGTPELSKGIGFTKEDTQQVLRDCRLDKYSDLVSAHYDGYHFGLERMYCPWDVMNFCKKNYQNVGGREAYIVAENYWKNTSGNAVIEEYMGYIEPEHIDKMQALLDGNPITAAIRTSLCYGDLKYHDIEDFWTLLLYTGYLTFDPDSIRYGESDDGDFVCDVRIPNKEIKLCFQNRIMSFYKKNPLTRNSTADLVKGLFSGDAQAVEDNLTGLLQKYVSLRDFAANAPKENYYHGFLNGVLTGATSSIKEQGSNFEAGNGYVDLLIMSKDAKSVAIIEIKKTDKDDDDKHQLAKKGLEQIKSKKYAGSYVNKEDITSVYIYGICFFKKYCSVVSEKLK